MEARRCALNLRANAGGRTKHRCLKYSLTARALLPVNQAENGRRKDPRPRHLYSRRIRPESRRLPIACAYSVDTHHAPHGAKEVIQNGVAPKVSIDEQQLRSGESGVARHQ